MVCLTIITSSTATTAAWPTDVISLTGQAPSQQEKSRLGDKIPLEVINACLQLFKCLLDLV